MYRVFLAIFLLMSAHLFARQDNFVLRNYTAVDGLPQSQINGMGEDANGYLWLATYGGGLARFDGQNFKVYTTLDGLLNNIVYDLTIDKNQNIWTVHPQGISRFDGSCFKTFRTPSNRKMVRRALVFQDTVIVLAAPGVLGKIHKDSVYYWNKEYKPGALINRIFQFESGELCIIMSDKRVFVKTITGDKLAGTLGGDNMIYSAYRENGNLKLEAYSPKEKAFGYYEVNPEGSGLEFHKKDSDYTVMLSDERTRTQWIRDEYNNLFKVKTGEIRGDTILKDRAINYLLPDSEGNIWIGSNGSGLFKYYHQDFSKIGPESLVGVMAVLQDDEEAIWAGAMNHGIWKMGAKKISAYNNNDEILCVIKKLNGEIWVGGKGIGRYDKKQDKFIWYGMKDGLAGNLILGFAEDEKENLWIGTGTGLSYYNGEKFTNYKTEHGLLTDRVNSVHYVKKLKTLFVGNEFGVNTVHDGKIAQLDLKAFENTTILSIHSYRDSLLLIGSGGAGFAVYNPVSKETQVITTHAGLVSDFIYFITADDENKIWVGTEKGISRIVLDDKLRIIENMHFDHDNGLRGVETNQNAFYFKGKRKLFGLIDGLYQFNELNEVKSQSFGVHLTDVEVYYGEDSSRQYSDSVAGFFKIPVKPEFPYNKNHITFSFNRVDKLYPKSVKFRYKLTNHEKGWSKPSSSRQVTYSNLPPGKYEFVVMATNSMGNWSEAQLRYPFTIKAAFYQTAAFGITVFVILSMLIILFFYLRLRKKVERALLTEKIRAQEQETLRKEIARDFHDEMGNQLTRIINYVSLLKLNGSVNNPAASRTDLYTKVENSAKYLYTGTRDFIWSIDPVNDELSRLFIYIRDFGEKLFEEKEIKFRAFNDVKIKVKLPYGFSREANLIFKEAMTNTFKSSQAQNASFSLLEHPDGFEFVFEDDGVGFDVNNTPGMNGVKNIRDRAEKINASLNITSGEGTGTRISLSFQFIKNKKHDLTH